VPFFLTRLSRVRHPRGFRVAPMAVKTRYLPGVADLSQRVFSQLCDYFGNDAPSLRDNNGKEGTLLNTGGEGSPRWQFVTEKEITKRFDVDKKQPPNILLPGDKTSTAGMGRRRSIPPERTVRLPAFGRQPNATCSMVFTFRGMHDGGAVLLSGRSSIGTARTRKSGNEHQPLRVGIAPASNNQSAT